MRGGPERVGARRKVELRDGDGAVGAQTHPERRARVVPLVQVRGREAQPVRERRAVSAAPRVHALGRRESRPVAGILKQTERQCYPMGQKQSQVY